MSPSSTSLTHDELFRLLGNRQRMRIIQVLWDSFAFERYVTGTLEPVSFSTLLEATDASDSGNFNYHLGQLVGSFVEQREDGYVLGPLGYNLMRAIERFGSFEYWTIPETPLETPCPFCNGTLVGEYDREMVGVRCTECIALSDGNLTYVQFPGTSTRQFDLPTILDIGTLRLESKLTLAKRGFCPTCSAPIEREYRLCQNHAADETGECPSCEKRFGSIVSANCPQCRWSGTGPLVEYAMIDPSVRACFSRNDLGPDDIGPWRFRVAAFASVEEIRENGSFPIAFQFFPSDDKVDIKIKNNGGVPVSKEPG